MITKDEFFIAAHQGNIEIIKSYIEDGGDINVRDNYGVTALMCSVLKGHDKGVSILIKANADIEIKDNDGDTALIISEKKGNKKIIQLINDKIICNDYHKCERIK